MVTCFAAVWAGSVDAGRIEIERFEIAPVQLERNGSFEVSATTKASDVPIVSYVLRTSRPMEKGLTPPSLTLYDGNRKLAFMEEDGQVHLKDNGTLDLDPVDNAFRIRIDTASWPEGKHDLVFFAHNRPGGGSHIKDQRNFVVHVETGRVRVVDQSSLGETRFTRCVVSPVIAEVGDEVTLRVAWGGSGADGIKVRQPYYVRIAQSPAPFTYDEDHVSRLLDEGEPLLRDNGGRDRNNEAGTMDIPLDTTGWQPGLYHLEVALPNTMGRSDLRHTVLSVRAPEDHLRIEVSSSWPMIPGTHAERMTRTAEGTLLHTGHFSTDDGSTWRSRESGTLGSGSVQFRDGRVLGMAYRTLPVDGREGWYFGQRYESVDGGKTVNGPLETLFHVPQAKAAHGHALHPGPLYMRSIVERRDGSLVALMAGWFKGDDEPCPYNPRRPYSRTYTCESDDGGGTWRYLSTIGYDHIGSEGYNEGVLEQLPDGRLIAVMRTGSMKDAKCHDNPIMVSLSSDGGATWSEPRRTGMHGAFPDLAVLSDGTLALSYGRPGASVAFSRDNGITWTDHTAVDPTPYSGYTSICETAPGELLMAFGTKDRVDPKTGELSSGIRMARIRYAEREE
jgi:hypothetical protein